MSAICTQSTDVSKPRKSMQIFNKLKQYHDSKLDSTKALPEVVNDNMVKAKNCSYSDSFCSQFNREKNKQNIELSRKNLKYSNISFSGLNFFNTTDKHLIRQNSKATMELGLVKGKECENTQRNSEGKSEKETSIKSKNQSNALRINTNSTISVNNYVKNNIDGKNEIKNEQRIEKKKNRCFVCRFFGF